MADEGRILRQRRVGNQRRAMPGGAFQAGETPAEDAVREVLEETRPRCDPVALVGVFGDGDVLVLTLTGKLLDGTEFSGQDVVWIVKKK